MPRRPRITLPCVPLHIIQRSNNRQACSYRAEDYSVYLRWLEEYARENQCAIQAYVLMTNHVHLLLTPETTAGADHGSRTIVLSRGMLLMLRTCQETLAMLEKRHIAVHVADLKAAAEIYNRLASSGGAVGGPFNRRADVVS